MVSYTSSYMRMRSLKSRSACCARTRTRPLRGFTSQCVYFHDCHDAPDLLCHTVRITAPSAGPRLVQSCEFMCWLEEAASFSAAYKIGHTASEMVA